MPNASAKSYPSQYESEVLLKDGSKIWLRPIRTNDSEEWLAFVSRLSPHSKFLRFFNVPKEMTLKDAMLFCTVDYKDTFAIVAEVMRGGRKNIVGIGRYYRLPRKDTAEVALAVEDAYQEKGIGTALMEALVKAALDNGITTFEADILAVNELVLTVLKDCGFEVTSQYDSGVFHVSFPITHRISTKGGARQ